eukprot:9791909-Alexandrium_andersonii.AAC.1
MRACTGLLLPTTRSQRAARGSSKVRISVARPLRRGNWPCGLSGSVDVWIFNEWKWSDTP